MTRHCSELVFVLVFILDHNTHDPQLHRKSQKHTSCLILCCLCMNKSQKVKYSCSCEIIDGQWCVCVCVFVCTCWETLQRVFSVCELYSSHCVGLPNSATWWQDGSPAHAETQTQQLRVQLVCADSDSSLSHMTRAAFTSNTGSDVRGHHLQHLSVVSSNNQLRARNGLEPAENCTHTHTH